jgi:hypothetical protein
MGHHKDGFDMVYHMQKGEIDKGAFSRKYSKGAAIDAAVLRQKNSTEERPTPMRAAMVDSYVKGVLERSGGEAGGMSTIIKEIYRKNMDNRILNNLR